jgi:hypothetical protein
VAPTAAWLLPDHPTLSWPRSLAHQGLAGDHVSQPHADCAKPMSSQAHGHSHWKDLLLFHEYFHGDSGRGCGASHQTGWTALVAKLLQQSGEQHTPFLIHSSDGRKTSRQ